MRSNTAPLCLPIALQMKGACIVAHTHSHAPVTTRGARKPGNSGRRWMGTASKFGGLGAFSPAGYQAASHCHIFRVVLAASVQTACHVVAIVTGRTTSVFLFQPSPNPDAPIPILLSAELVSPGAPFTMISAGCSSDGW